MNVRAIDKFHNTRVGFLVFGLVEAAFSFTLLNLAIPSGDWWEWLLSLILLIGVIQNFGRLVIGHK